MVSYIRCSHYGTRDAQIAIYFRKVMFVSEHIPLLIRKASGQSD